MAGVIAAIGLGVSAAASIGQMVSGAVKTSRAKKALQNYQRQELKTVTDDMRVSTLGAELQARQAQQRAVSTIDALQSGGVRGVVGGPPPPQAMQQNLNQKISADLDRQFTNIQRIQAQDRQRVQAMQERREMQDLAGLGSQLGMARQQTQAGMSGLMSTAVATTDAAAQGAFE